MSAASASAADAKVTWASAALNSSTPLSGPQGVLQTLRAECPGAASLPLFDAQTCDALYSEIKAFSATKEGVAAGSMDLLEGMKLDALPGWRARMEHLTAAINTKFGYGTRRLAYRSAFAIRYEAKAPEAAATAAAAKPARASKAAMRRAPPPNASAAGAGGKPARVLDESKIKRHKPGESMYYGGGEPAAAPTDPAAGSRTANPVQTSHFEHFDQTDVTLNINIGEVGFKGGELLLAAHRRDGSVWAPIAHPKRYMHGGPTPPQAVAYPTDLAARYPCAPVAIPAGIRRMVDAGNTSMYGSGLDALDAGDREWAQGFGISQLYELTGLVERLSELNYYAWPHARGHGLFHSGYQLHMTRPVASGTRVNVICWFASVPTFTVWAKLPKELRLRALQFLDAPALAVFRRCSRECNEVVANDAQLWRPIFRRKFCVFKRPADQQQQGQASSQATASLASAAGSPSAYPPGLFPAPTLKNLPAGPVPSSVQPMVKGGVAGTAVPLIPMPPGGAGGTLAGAVPFADPMGLKAFPPHMQPGFPLPVAHLPDGNAVLPFGAVAPAPVPQPGVATFDELLHAPADCFVPKPRMTELMADTWATHMDHLPPSILRTFDALSFVPSTWRCHLCWREGTPLESAVCKHCSKPPAHPLAAQLRDFRARVAAIAARAKVLRTTRGAYEEKCARIVARTIVSDEMRAMMPMKMMMQPDERKPAIAFTSPVAPNGRVSFADVNAQQFHDTPECWIQ